MRLGVGFVVASVDRHYACACTCVYACFGTESKDRVEPLVHYRSNGSRYVSVAGTRTESELKESVLLGDETSRLSTCFENYQIIAVSDGMDKFRLRLVAELTSRRDFFGIE